MKYIFAKLIQDGDVPLPKPPATSDAISNTLQLVFVAAGAIAVLIIILGSLKYIMSQGEPQATAKAKDTILYAIIGLVICILSFSAVTFLLKNI